AALAALLGVPVVLVLDCRGMTRGIAPLLLGYQAFDPDITIGGVILNRTGGTRHESQLRSAIEHHPDIPALGALPEDPDLRIEERHLGLIPSAEHRAADAPIDRLGQAMTDHLDLARILTLGGHGAAPPAAAPTPASPPAERVRLAVARDSAFCFYYET